MSFCTSNPRLLHSMARGALVVLEGCDRAGKTTQGKMVVEKLKAEGKLVQFFRFPERTTNIGIMIDKYLKCSSDLDDHAIHLLFSANRWELVPKMKKLITDGVTLVVDRYAYSGVAFSAAKKGMSLEWCKQSDVGLPQPDVVIFFNLSPEEAEKRGNFGEERYEKQEFQDNVRKNYDILKDDFWQVVDADQSIEQVQKNIHDLIVDQIEKVKNSNLGKLWIDEK